MITELLIDLCARLPYNVRIECGHSSTILYDIRPDTGVINNMYGIDNIKPYLRPMSSMTKEEKEIYQGYQDAFYTSSGDVNYFDSFMSIDYLNCKHFDYRGLIEKGLALEAPEGMYNN